MPPQFFWDNKFMNRHIPGPIRSFYYSYPRPIRKNKKSEEKLKPQRKAKLGSERMIEIAKPKITSKRLWMMISAITYLLPMSHFKYRNSLDRKSHPFLKKIMNLNNKKAPSKRPTVEKRTPWSSYFSRMLCMKIKNEDVVASMKEEKRSEMAIPNGKSDKPYSLLERKLNKTSNNGEYLEFNNKKVPCTFYNSQNLA